MHDSLDIARRDINRDALLETIGECLRVEHGPVEEFPPRAACRARGAASWLRRRKSPFDVQTFLSTVDEGRTVSTYQTKQKK
jgi:hypothetical protein